MFNGNYLPSFELHPGGAGRQEYTSTIHTTTHPGLLASCKDSPSTHFTFSLLSKHTMLIITGLELVSSYIYYTVLTDTNLTSALQNLYFSSRWMTERWLVISTCAAGCPCVWGRSHLTTPPGWTVGSSQAAAESSQWLWGNRPGCGQHVGRREHEPGSTCEWKQTWPFHSSKPSHQLVIVKERWVTSNWNSSMYTII